jgi:hypothetical protein
VQPPGDSEVFCLITAHDLPWDGLPTRPTFSRLDRRPKLLTFRRPGHHPINKSLWNRRRRYASQSRQEPVEPGQLLLTFPAGTEMALEGLALVGREPLVRIFVHQSLRSITTHCEFTSGRTNARVAPPRRKIFIF